MGRIHSTFILFTFFVLFLFSPASTVFSVTAEDVEKEVIELFDPSEFIPQVKITPAEKDRFIIELTFSIGDRWGRDGFVRDLAKSALTRIFNSGLPLAQGIVKVYCTDIQVIHLAIGVNQSKEISWEESSGSSDFFDKLRSCARWGKRPEDRTYFIEHKQITKPSPIVSLPPGL